MGSTRVPKAQPLALPPKEQDKEVQEAIADAIRRRAGAKGYRSTILAKSMMSPETAAALKMTMGS